MNLSPLSDETNKCLRLDGRPAFEFNGVSAKLDGYTKSMETCFIFCDVVGS